MLRGSYYWRSPRPDHAIARRAREDRRRRVLAACRSKAGKNYAVQLQKTSCRPRQLSWISVATGLFLSQPREWIHRSAKGDLSFRQALYSHDGSLDEPHCKLATAAVRRSANSCSSDGGDITLTSGMYFRTFIKSSRTSE